MSFQPWGALISSHPAMPQTLCYLQPKPYTSLRRTSFSGVLNPVAPPRRWRATYAEAKKNGAEKTGSEVNLQPDKTKLMKLTKARLAQELLDRGHPHVGLKNDLADSLKIVLEQEQGSESGTDGSKDILIGCSASFLLAKKKAELVELCTERGLPTGTKKVMAANLLEFLKGNSDLQAQDQGVPDTEVSQISDSNIQKSDIDSSTTREDLLGMQMVNLRSFLTTNDLGPARSKAVAVDKILKFYESGEDGQIIPGGIGNEPVLDTAEAFSSEPKYPLPGETALPLTLNKMESTILELVDGMTMEGVRKFKKDELNRILKTSGVQLSGSKSNMMKELEAVYKRAKSIVKNAELLESGQSLKESDLEVKAEPEDKDKSVASMSGTTADSRETTDINRPSLVQNKALIGDERVILEDLLEEMHVKYGRYFESSKQENLEMNAATDDGLRVDDALDALQDLDSITDEDISKTVAWAESAPKGANP